MSAGRRQAGAGVELVRCGRTLVRYMRLSAMDSTVCDQVWRGLDPDPPAPVEGGTSCEPSGVGPIPTPIPPVTHSQDIGMKDTRSKKELRAMVAMLSKRGAGLITERDGLVKERDAAISRVEELQKRYDVVLKEREAAKVRIEGLGRERDSWRQSHDRVIHERDRLEEQAHKGSFHRDRVTQHYEEQLSAWLMTRKFIFHVLGRVLDVPESSPLSIERIIDMAGKRIEELEKPLMLPLKKISRKKRGDA